MAERSENDPRDYRVSSADVLVAGDVRQPWNRGLNLTLGLLLPVFEVPDELREIIELLGKDSGRVSPLFVEVPEVPLGCPLIY